VPSGMTVSKNNPPEEWCQTPSRTALLPKESGGLEKASRQAMCHREILSTHPSYRAPAVTQKVLAL